MTFQNSTEITWLVTFCGQLLRMRSSERAYAVATVEVPEVLMDEHQKLFCFTDLRRRAGFFYPLRQRLSRAVALFIG